MKACCAAGDQRGGPPTPLGRAPARCCGISPPAWTGTGRVARAGGGAARRGRRCAGCHATRHAELRRELVQLAMARTYEKQSRRIALRSYTWTASSAAPAWDAEGHSAYAVAFADLDACHCQPVCVGDDGGGCQQGGALVALDFCH